LAVLLASAVPHGMMPAPMRSSPYLSLLRRNPDFARLYGAQLTSFAGDWFATVALLGLALQMTGSSAIASLVLVLQTGGFAAASPLAGMLADRLDRRRLMIGADLARIPVALAFLLARDPETLWIAFAAVLLLAIGGAVFEPTSSASLPNLVSREDLPTANVLIGSAWGTMLAVGAALGGIVAATLGRDAAFVINALSFAVSAWLILGIRRPLQEARDPATDVVAGVRQGIATAVGFARTSRMVGAFVLSKTSFGVGTGVVALLAVFGSEVFDAGDAGIGVLFAARGLGALVGPFVARSVMGTDDRGLIRGIAASFVAAAGCYALFPLAPQLWVAALFVFGAHCGGGAQWALSTLGIQRSTPDAIRGRVFSLDYGLVTLTIAVSTLLAGFLADVVEARLAVWVMVALIVAAGTAWIAFARPILSGGRATLEDR
jgi:predicted MFS family arabinose efflux permease